MTVGAFFRRPVYLLSSALVTISTLGAIAAGQNYFLVQATKDAVLSQRILEETFLSTLKASQGESISSTEKGVAAHSERTSMVNSGIDALIGEVELRVIVGCWMWCVTFLLSSLALFMTRKR
jgi:hypothetical protein